MKIINQYLFFAVTALLALNACTSYDADDKKFGNVVYLDVAKTTDVQSAIIKKTLDETDRTFSATLAYPSSEDVTVSLSVNPALASRYNARFGTQWPVLDRKYYELSSETITIPAGKTTSEVVKLHFKDLLGEGEAAAGELPLNETYLLPVTIANSSVSVLQSSSTVFYLVKRSSNITTAAQLTDNWINFPTLDKYSEQSMVFNGHTAMTYEALIYIDDFASTDSNGDPVNISTVMGIEDYLLLRIGDTNFSRYQLQFDGSGASFGKFPKTDDTKNLQKGQWYHVACTYDQTTRMVRIYVNGKIQSEGTEMGVTAPSETNRINFARRALYDLYSKTTNPADKKAYEDLGYNNWADARQLFISYSYNQFRPLNGKIAEARVWSVARTPEQIWESMYEVDPKSEGLLGYWKFNEGKGDIVYDQTGRGNDGVAEKPLEWPDGVEIPEINKVEE